MRGAFVTIEGIEGVGKTSSLAFIERCLAGLGRPVRVTREPGGTPLAELIREYVLKGEHGGLAPVVEALLMFAARADHLEKLIRPALERGEWVVCDRFTDATFAYQGGGRGVDAQFLECLRAGVHAGFEPDVTLLLDAPVEVGRARIREREPDHFEREHAEFFGRVRRAYLDLAAEHPERIRLIDAARPKAAVERDLERVLVEFSSRFGGS